MILTLVRIRRVVPIIIHPKPDDELEQFCRSLQIVTRRDTDGTVTTVIRTMMTEFPQDSVGSTELAQKTNLNRVTILHHLKRLQDAGIVQKYERRYRLSPHGFGEVVRKMREQTEQMFSQAQDLARKLDEQYMIEQSQNEIRQRRRLSKLSRED